MKKMSLNEKNEFNDFFTFTSKPNKLVISKNFKLLFYYFIYVKLLMRKTISFMIIALIAAIIETGAIAPIIAHDVTGENKNPGGICPPFFVLSSTALGKHPDHNFNGEVCSITVTLEDRDRRFALDDFILFKGKVS